MLILFLIIVLRLLDKKIKRRNYFNMKIVICIWNLQMTQARHWRNQAARRALVWSSNRNPRTGVKKNSVRTPLGTRAESSVTKKCSVWKSPPQWDTRLRGVHGDCSFRASASGRVCKENASRRLIVERARPTYSLAVALRWRNYPPRENN